MKTRGPRNLASRPSLGRMQRMDYQDELRDLERNIAHARDNMKTLHMRRVTYTFRDVEAYNRSVGTINNLTAQVSRYRTRIDELRQLLSEGVRR